jgi:hypothetical protein
MQRARQRGTFQHNAALQRVFAGVTLAPATEPSASLRNASPQSRPRSARTSSSPRTPKTPPAPNAAAPPTAMHRTVSDTNS